jgi:rubrerythrin
MDGERGDVEDARRALVAILQGAYSGELAACFAYQGHAASVEDPDEIWQIHAIEADEWEHRQRVGEILADLGSAPLPGLDRKMTLVGKTIGLLCRFGGWFIPMYGAGRLERGNIVEYEHAARRAYTCGRSELVDDLLDMAEVEWDHERYFREKTLSHVLARVIPVWSEPPPRDSIRASFEREHGLAARRS